MRPATVYYDGSCGLCNRTVDVGRRHGRPDALRFVDNASLEGEEGLEACGLRDAAQDSLVVSVGDRQYVRSAAAIRVAWRLRGWRRLGVVAWLVPRPLRDWGYRLVARNRHRL